MNKFLFLSLLTLSTSALTEDLVHWSYEGLAGPKNWGELSNAYSTCKTGKFQSPIDIRDALPAELPALPLKFHTAAEQVMNNGHTLQIIVNDEDDFHLDNDTFKLKQYHFHSPSENLINGKQYPLEVHFVHANEKGELAVLSVMFETGKENPALNPILDSLPLQPDQPILMAKHLNLKNLFPNDRHYYRFSGSLTTPPCTEGLRWLVMKNSVTLSVEQLSIFQLALKHSNNRPVQPLNGRIVVN